MGVGLGLPVVGGAGAEHFGLGIKLDVSFDADNDVVLHNDSFMLQHAHLLEGGFELIEVLVGDLLGQVKVQLVS